MDCTIQQIGWRSSLLYGTIFCLPLSISLIAGYNYINYGSTLLMAFSTLSKIFAAFAILMTLFQLSLRVFFGGGSKKSRLFRLFESKHSYWLYVVLFIILWLPYFISAYPGLFVYDAFTQTHYSMGLNIVNSFHPLAHTYLLSLFLQVGKLMADSYGFGLSLYCAVQMLIQAMTFAYILKEVFKHIHSSALKLAMLLFFSLFPVFPIMALSATKDTLFSCALALFVLQCYKLLSSSDTFFEIKSNKVLLIVAGIVASVFRNNGLYAVLAMLLILFIAFRSKRSAIFPALLTCAIISIALGGIIPKVVSVISSPAAEMLGVPIQQISRAVNDHLSEISDEEIAEVERLIPSWDLYSPGIADEVKFAEGTSDLVSDNLPDFISLWLRFAFRYPGSYVDAFTALTYGYWYPFATYNSIGTLKPYLEFDPWLLADSNVAVRNMGDHAEVFNCENVDEYIFIPNSNLMPSLTNAIRAICYRAPWANNVLTAVFTNASTWLWAAYYAFIRLAMFHKMEYKALFGLFIYILTCLLGPVFLIRYAYAVYVSIPLIFLFCYQALQTGLSGWKAPIITQKAVPD